MGKQGKKEVTAVFVILSVFFALFLVIPLISIFCNAFMLDKKISLSNIINIFGDKSFYIVLKNSMVISLFSGVISTVVAFVLAYTVNYTNINSKIKKIIEGTALLPMLLPTITYGFAIIYTFGKQGLVTKLIGVQLFDIYGFTGMAIGFVVYTVPIAYLMTNNAMKYIDKKFSVVSNVMGDSGGRNFINTVLIPLIGTLGASFVQVFFLCFTDFGIPGSVGGEYKVIATTLYNAMLGSVPNFGTGAVVALAMLVPSVASIALMSYLERFNIRYNKISIFEPKKNIARDIFLGITAVSICGAILVIFAVIFIVPFVTSWPYDMRFTLANIKQGLSSSNLTGVMLNSLRVSALTALFGTLVAYVAAIVTARSRVSRVYGKVFNALSLVTNAVPGMVLGIAYLLCFSGTPIQNTFVILIACNIVHYFTTPYLMCKGCLEKMNSSWETTAELMGDSWINTVVRIVTPNAVYTIFEVFGYYFVNSMVTVSALVFLVGAYTNVMTTKIKELQYFAKFNEVFILSIMIMFTNILVKIIIKIIQNKRRSKE